MSQLSNVFLVLLFVIKCMTLPPETLMLPPEMIKMQGYPCEKHIVTTSDGYILTHYRIPGNNKGVRFKPNLKPVMLVHGFVTSSKDFLLLGNQSLPYKLVDAGYDVWLINMRGTEETRHIHLSKDDGLFWDFGYDEQGVYDIPESMEYILNATTSDKVNYIGFSLGCTVQILMCNERPDLNDKVLITISLNPGFYKSKLNLKAGSTFNLDVLQLMNRLGMNHLHVSKSFRLGVVNFCNLNEVTYKLCYTLLFMVVGENWESVTEELTPMLFGRYLPFSIKQIHHMFQHMATGVFRKFDYGIEENIARYGTAMPPEYNLKACSAPNFIVYAKNDNLISPKDVKMFVKALGGSKFNGSVKSMYGDRMNHMDVIVSRNGIKQLYNYLVKTINRFNSAS